MWTGNEEKVFCMSCACLKWSEKDQTYYCEPNDNDTSKKVYLLSQQEIRSPAYCDFWRKKV